jgi:hypothetical protein
VCKVRYEELGALLGVGGLMMMIPRVHNRIMKEMRPQAGIDYVLFWLVLVGGGGGGGLEVVMTFWSSEEVEVTIYI